MEQFALIWEWLTTATRWLHVVTAMAWIGSSFYFIALDLGLRKRPDLPVGAYGEEWQVHAGGFYHIQKYLVAPKNMPDHLTWFKWESYWTWMSGFLMLVLVYYGNAQLFLIDRSVLDISPTVGIIISLASLIVGWLIYDLLCKSRFGNSTYGLIALLYVVLVFMAWGYTHVFTGRAAFLHLGAFTGTMMAANVFFIIIPNQKKVIKALLAGETPEAKYGIQAKQRSLHNNYLVLPVIFFMLSNHYPLAFATHFNWIIAALVFILGILIRHYFNTIHAGKGNPHWTWALSVIIFIIMMWLSTVPSILTGEKNIKLSAATQGYLSAHDFSKVSDTIAGRCGMCHSNSPEFDGIYFPPKGVILDNDNSIAKYAREIYYQAGISHAMPPGNVTAMTKAERQLIANWYRKVD